MRIHLTRLTLCAAGVVLTGVGMATAAHAGEDGLSLEETPIHIEETVPVVPEVHKCNIEFTIEDCAVPVGEGPQPVFTLDPELVDPGLIDDDDDAPEPGDDTPQEPEDGGPEKPEGGESEPVDDGQGGQSEPTGDSSGDSSPDTSGGTSDDASSRDATEESTPESDEATVIPVSQQTPADEGGGRSVLFGVLAIALGSVGLAIVGFGFGRRPQAARKR